MRSPQYPKWYDPRKCMVFFDGTHETPAPDMYITHPETKRWIKTKWRSDKN